MTSRRASPAHQEAVQRRLAQLGAELAGLREADLPPELPPDLPPEPTHTRVAAGRAARAVLPPVAPPVVPVVEESPPPLPRPGRHAARRPRGALAPETLLPETLRGRFALSPAALAVVAVLAALGLAVTCWSVVRSDATPVAAPATSPGSGLVAPAPEGATAGPAPPGASTTAPAGQVTVDVTGRVRRPGIVVLDAGSRVVDALEAAGGARPGVDLSGLNLARVLSDGEQVVVGVPAPVGAAGAVPPPVATPAPVAAVVNLNTADQAQLETLPEVGPVTAAAIITWRGEHGGFTAVEELLEVDGIGEATLATLTPHVTV